MPKPITIAFVLPLLVALAGCSKYDVWDEMSDVRQCERLRDHVIDVRLETASGVDHEAHRAAMKAALGKDFVADCQSRLTYSQRRCALDAEDADELHACAPTASEENP
jgi:hypothetical protein